MNNLPVNISFTESHKTIVFLIYIQVLHQTLAKKIIKTPEQQLTMVPVNVHV